MTIAIVVARAKNNVIGKGMEIPWQVKGEQKRFRDITMGGVLVMGRKTFESIGKPLSGRETIIVTRNKDYAAAGCQTAPSLEAALSQAGSSGKHIYVVGGGEIYSAALPLVDGVHISTINIDAEGDIFFPEFPTEDFFLIREEHISSNIDYVYQYFERKHTIRG